MDVERWTRYFLYLFVFWLPFQTVLLVREPLIGGEKWQYGTIGVYGTDILLLVAILFFVFPSAVEGSAKEKRRSFDGLGMTEWTLIFFAFWTGLSIFWASDKILAWYFFVKLILAAGLFFVARSVKIDLKKIIFVLMAAAVIQSGIGIAQFLSQETIGSPLFGMSAHEAWRAGTSVLKTDSGRFLRAYGTFPHPNMLGGFLAIVFVMALVYFSVFPSAVEGSAKEKRRSFDRLGMTLRKSLPIVALVIILLGLILSFSRAAWLGVAFGIVFLVAYLYDRTQPKRNAISRLWSSVTFLKMLGMLVLSAALFVFVLCDQVFSRFEGAAIDQEGSMSERIVSLQDAKRLIAEHPMNGTGAGGSTAEIIRQNPDRPAWSIQPPHNVFILVFSELGLVGIALFIAFLGMICWRARKEKNAIVLIALLTLVPSLFLDHWLWSSHFGILFFFFVIGGASHTRSSIQEKTPSVLFST